MMDYGLPKADALPSYVTDRTVTPSPINPLGVKGAGETGTIASTPAIANAVMDAIEPFGVRHLDMPLTPGKIWKAVAAAKRKKREAPRMYPATFQYHSPKNVKEPLALLGNHTHEPKSPWAGHTPHPMMNP